MGSMDNDAFKMFLQNIEEYVMDEDKIVTYKWLSKNFSIHVNTAKQLLYSFASSQKDKVHLTYLIGGFLKNSVGCSVQIVREDDVDKIKSEFKLVTSEHIYSVQKAKALPDLNILYTVDVDRNTKRDEDKRLGSIKCDHPVLRSDDEVSGLKRKTQCAVVDMNEKKWPSKKSSVTSAVKGTEGEKQMEEAGNSKSVDTSSGGNNANKKEPKKNGIAAMFAAQNTKTKHENDAEVKGKRTETKKPKAENGISAFFNRQVNKQLKPAGPKNDSGVSSQSDSQDSPKKMEVDSENTTDNNVKIDENKTIQHKKEDKTEQHEKEDKTVQYKKEDKTIQHKKETNKKEIVSKSKDIKQKSNERKGGRRKNKKASVNKESPPTKKRKRIVIMSDSEDSSDDGIFDKEEEDEGICYSPVPQPPDIDGDDNDVIPPTPDPPLKKGRKRIRKLIDNTYMDKDGYMLTRKEYVFESCTESEPEEKEKENKTKDNSEHERTEKVSPKVDKKEPSPKKKKVSPQNIKQASIMNFFKKK